MADIELVIKISEEMYNMACNYPEMVLAGYPLCIKKGTPLPKGHGRLIDAERYRNEMLDSREFNFFKTLDIQPTIIEADKEESEDKR